MTTPRLIVPIRECSCGGTMYLYGPGIEHVGQRVPATTAEQIALHYGLRAVWACARCDSTPSTSVAPWGGLIDPAHAMGTCSCATRQHAERDAADRRRMEG